jgi:anti-sigma factor RsiW
MDCKEAKTWLQGYLDDELDLRETVEIERHLESCGSCSEARDSQRVLRDSIQASGLRFRCPDDLRANMKSLIAREVGKPEGVESDKVRPNIRQVPPNISRWWLAIAASFLLVAVSLLAWRPMSRQTYSDTIAQQVVASHVRSLLADHLMDVASSDRHTVKPWFSGKLDFSPTVIDLSAEGFPLDGGRLDYLDHRPVAAVVYHRRKHAINLFLWPSEGVTDESLQSVTYQGYQLVHWSSAGFNYWAISDLNVPELREFAETIRSAGK